MGPAGATPREAVVHTLHSAGVRSARFRLLLPWLGTVVFGFLLFRLLFGHLYVMRGACECGQAEQWYEFNDRPYTIGVRFSSRPVAMGQAGHNHFYPEPARTRRF